MSKKLKIVSISSELDPFSKTGGLADVARSLPKSLRRLGHEVIVISPFYTKTLDRKKHKLESLKKILKAKKIKPQNAIIIGDSPEETEIGKKLGLKTIAITKGFYSTKRLKEIKPDYLISNMGRIIKIIKKILSTK